MFTFRGNSYIDNNPILFNQNRDNICFQSYIKPKLSISKDMERVNRKENTVVNVQKLPTQKKTQKKGINKKQGLMGLQNIRVEKNYPKYY